MKKVLAISSLLLGVVFLAGCSQQSTRQTQPTTPVPVAQTPTQPVAVQPAPTTPSVDETASWQTYKNDEYWFEFQYPSYLNIVSNISTFTVSITTLSNGTKGGNLKNEDIVLSIRFAIKAINLDTELNQIKSMAKDGGATISRYKELSIDGFPSIQQLEDVKVSDPGCYWSTYIKKDDRYDKITLMSAKCDTITNVEDDYSKILSTFKFTK